MVDYKGGIGRIDKEKMMVETIKKETALRINKSTIRSRGESGTYGLSYLWHFADRKVWRHYIGKDHIR